MGYSIHFSVCICIYAVYEFGNGLEGHSEAYGGPHMAQGLQLPIPAVKANVTLVVDEPASREDEIRPQSVEYHVSAFSQTQIKKISVHGRNCVCSPMMGMVENQQTTLGCGLDHL